MSNISWPRALCAWVSRTDRACEAGEVAGLLGRGEGLLVPVKITEGDGLVDLQQEPQVGERRVGRGHGEGAVEQRQRVGVLPLHGGDEDQHVQRPAHRPEITGILRGSQRGVGGLPAFRPGRGCRGSGR